MPHPFRYLSLLLLLLISPISKGQNNVLFQKEDKVVIPITFAASPQGSEITTNYFIGEIARCAQKKIEFTQYNYTFTKVIRVVEEQAGHYTATLEFADLNCTGDAYYRGFSIGDALIPKNASLLFQVYGNQTVPFVNQEIKAVPLEAGYNKMGSFSFSDTSKVKKYKAQTGELRFSFDNTSVDRFTAKLKLIDDYFLAGPLINSYMQQLRSIDINNTDMLIVYDIRLKDVGKAFESLYQTDFPGKLQLTSNDPVQLIDKINNFSDSLFLMKNQMKEKIGNLDKIYFAKGIAELQKGEIQKAETLFERSSLYNPNFAPSQFELAKIRYRRDSLFSASNTLVYILQKLNPDTELQKQVLMFTDTVYNKMIAVGQEYVRVEKFNEAVEMFEHCIKFCSDIPGYFCPDKQLKGLAGAKFGIYQSYLSVSQKAMDNGKIELAEIYIHEALKYQKANSNDIISNAEAKLKMEKLTAVYVTKSDTLNGRQNFTKALFFLDKVKSISDSNQLTLSDRYYYSVSKAKNGIYKAMLKKSQQQLSSGDMASAENTLNEAIDFQARNSEEVSPSFAADTLLMRIKSVQYKEKIKQGKLYFSINEYSLALQYFDDARQLEQKYYLKAEPKLDSMIRSTAKPIIMAQLGSAEQLMSLLMVDSAAAVLNVVRKSQLLHLLGLDDEVNNKLQDMNSLLFSTKCKYQKNRYDSVYTVANYSILRQDYLTADDQLAFAIQISEKYPECNVDASTAISDKKLYLKNAAYQKLLQKARSAYELKNYPDYFYYYNEAETYYQQNLLFNTGLIHPKLAGMATISNDTLFVLKSFDYLTGKNKLEDALDCLKRLEILSYPQILSKGIQQQLGVKMALRDHLQNFSNNPVLMSLNYTADSKWLKYFKVAYVRTWRSMR
jgi:hypothetical protein